MKSFIEQIEQEEIDDELWDEIIDFLLELDEDQMFEEMQDRYFEILDELDIDYDDEEDMDEAVKRRVRISPAERAKRKRAYRKNKSKIKIKQARYRKTAGYKRYKKKAKRMGKRGLTSTGSRQRTFI